jgi:ubiquinone/menaquinone biosynthesis C-methylase UbiE
MASDIHFGSTFVCNSVVKKELALSIEERDRAHNAHRYILILIVFFLFCSFKCGVVYAAEQEISDFRINRETVRFRRTATDKFMEILAIKPGMTILDLGTGTGQFAYAFAEKMKGTGKVFATDIDIKCVNYVKKESKKRGLTNLYPVLVTRDSHDEFYNTHKFDLIIILNTTISLKKSNFIGGLRQSLAKEGRFIVVNNEEPPPFSENDFTAGFNGLVRKISREHSESPFYKYLRESTRTLLKQNREVEPDEVLKKALIEDFNGMLSDHRFGSNFVEGSDFKKDIYFSPEEKDFADSLLATMIDKGLFHKNKKALKRWQLRYAYFLNKLILFQKFRKYLHTKNLFASGITKEIIRDFERSGYKMENEYNDVVPFQYILVFKADITHGEKNE